MAGKLRGITIEISGDTTKLGKALSEAGKKTKDLQTELKGVNSLLKKVDPKNTELLTQKQRILTEEIASTKDKLQTLKEAQNQAQEQFERGELAEDAYRDLQREIIKTEDDLKSLEKELSDFGSVGAQKVAAVGEQMKDAGAKIEGVGKKASVLSAGIVAAGGAGVAAAMELDKGYDTIIQKTGATGDELAQMKQIADNLFTVMPVEMEDVGSAVGEVNTRFGLQGDALQTVSQHFLQYAKINGTDVASSVDSVQKAMAAFNVDSSEAGTMLDVLNKVGQDTGISMDTLSGLMTSNASSLKEMGFNAYQSASFLGQVEKSGVDTSAVMSGMKIAMKNAAAEGKTLDEGLSDLETQIKSATTSQEAINIATELFGSKAGPQLAVAIRDGTLSFEDLTQASNSLDDAVGSVSDTFEESLDPWDQAQTSMNQVKKTGAELGGTILQTLQPVLSGLTEKVKSVTTWFSGLSDGTKRTIVVILGIVAAVGPVLIIIGKVVGAVGTILTLAPKIKAAITAVKLATAGLNTTMLANPVFLIIAAVVALIAILVTLYKKCEPFREFVDSLGAKIKEVFGNIAGWINAHVVQPVIRFISKLVNTFRSAGGGIKGIIAALFAAVKSIFSAGFAFIDKLTGGKLSSMLNKFKSIFGKIKETVSKVFSAIKNIISNWKFKMPHISLPKFTITPAGWKIGDLLKGVRPHLSIAWHKKAMDDGMILNNPTIFGIGSRGQLLGGGEAGSETVVGTQSLLGMIDQTVANRLQSLDIVLLLDGDTLVARTADRMDAALGKISVRKVRGT